MLLEQEQAKWAKLQAEGGVMGVRSPDRLLATSVVMAVFALPPVAQKQIQQPRLGCAPAKVWRG